jgi:dTDP-4-amino-4,6-dideoxygalactose transaminase
MGCHRYKAYRDEKCGDMTVTNDMCSKVIFLPYYPDMMEEEVEHVAIIFKEALERA